MLVFNYDTDKLEIIDCETAAFETSKKHYLTLIEYFWEQITGGALYSAVVKSELNKASHTLEQGIFMTPRLRSGSSRNITNSYTTCMKTVARTNGASGVLFRCNCPVPIGYHVRWGLYGLKENYFYGYNTSDPKVIA